MDTIKKVLAALFARVSSKEQEETGYSLPAQEKFLQEYSRRQDVNLEVAKVFQISESASGRTERKIFKSMLEYVRKHKIPVIVVETTDRLTRNFADVPLIDAWLMEDEKHQIHLVKEGCVLHKNSKSHEWFMWRVKVATAEYYVKLLSENVKKGQKEKISQGSLPTKPPLGYKTIGEKGHKIHVIDEKVASHIKEMFNLYASGNYSTVALGKVMYQKGFRSRAGGRVVKSKIHKLLSDPFYYGNFVWKGKEYKGAHEPIIDKDLFDQVKAKMTRPNAPHHNKHEKELRGKVMCGSCGKTVTWETQKGHWYGACKQCKAQLAISRKYILQSEVEDALMTKIVAVAPRNERIMGILTQALKESHSEEIEYHDTQMNSINASLQRIQQRKRVMYEDKLDGRISTEFYDQKLDEFKQEEEYLGESLKKLNLDNTQYYKVGIAVHELASKANKIYVSQKATVEERRMLLSYAFADVKVLKGKVTPAYTKAFSFMADWMPLVNQSLERKQNTAKSVTPSGVMQDYSQVPHSEVMKTLGNSRTHKMPQNNALQETDLKSKDLLRG